MLDQKKKIDKCIVHIEDIIETITQGHCNRNTNLIYLEKVLELLSEIKHEIASAQEPHTL